MNENLIPNWQINIIIYFVVNLMFTIIYKILGKKHFSGFDSEKDDTIIGWFYFSSSISSQVSFGGHYPITDLGKIFVILHQFLTFVNITSVTSKIINSIIRNKDNNEVESS